MRDGLWRFDVQSEQRTLLASPPYEQNLERFNDGKCDVQGRFWAGSMYEPKDQALGTLYMLDSQGLHTMQGGMKDGVGSVMNNGVVTANGLAWSPDGRTAYWADTATHQVRAFDFDPLTGRLSAGRVFHQMSLKPAAWTWGDTATARCSRCTRVGLDAWLVRAY
mgnify:CR=1 FL=1